MMDMIFVTLTTLEKKREDIGTQKEIYHLLAEGWLEAMISVSLRSNALRSSQATCSRLDMATQLLGT
jgi:hypothetical protein